VKAADTNILVRLFTGDSPTQAEAARVFCAGGVWVSLLALAEAIWVVDSSYDVGRGKQAEFIRMLLKSENVIVQDSEVVEAALSLFRDKPSLGFTDCLMLEIARKAGFLPLGTFDRRLGREPDVERLI
jgi:predicted nucleic-acid-binding protein